MKIIKYKWKHMEPVFLTRGREISESRAMGSEIRVDFGTKKCTGFFSRGKHRDCGAHAGDERQCAECQARDDFFMCVKCTGSECINQKARAGCEKGTYSLYLAAFGPVVKVGISREFRLLERLVEQGADFGTRIASVRDGKEVRLVESAIKDAGIRDRMTGQGKSSLL